LSSYILPEHSSRINLESLQFSVRRENIGSIKRRQESVVP